MAVRRLGYEFSTELLDRELRAETEFYCKAERGGKNDDREKGLALKISRNDKMTSKALLETRGSDEGKYDFSDSFDEEKWHRIGRQFNKRGGTVDTCKSSLTTPPGARKHPAPADLWRTQT
jgi:hypothetical protein